MSTPTPEDGDDYFLVLEDDLSFDLVPLPFLSSYTSILGDILLWLGVPWASSALAAPLPERSNPEYFHSIRKPSSSYYAVCPLPPPRMDRFDASMYEP